MQDFENSALPPAEKQHIHIGYLRLTDAAPFIVANELDFYGKYGLVAELHQEVSWANVRDKVIAGTLDAAHMLAPLPAMTAMGASGLRQPMLTGLVLSNNGNAITLRTSLYEQVQERLAQSDLTTIPGALKQIAQHEQRTLNFATVHAFSTHTLVLRTWLSSGGVDLQQDVRTIVVPPSQMVDSLKSGIIDGYCVGEPWNTLAVNQGVGKIAALGELVAPDAPDKVLAVSAAWHQKHPAAHLRLRLALLDACRWLSEPNNLPAAAKMLAHPHYLDLDQKHLEPALFGHSKNPRSNFGNYQFYGLHINRPQVEKARQMIHACFDILDRDTPTETALQIAEQTFRTDLFDEATVPTQPITHPV